MRATDLNVAILYSILPGKELSIPVLYGMVHSICGKVPPPRKFRQILRKLVKKNILTMKETPNEPLCKLTRYGQLLRDYFYPISGLKNKYTTICVLPEIAAKETGFAISSIHRKKGHFHYLVVSKRLYVLKRVEIENLRSKIPTFPIVKNLLELAYLFPDPFHGIYNFLEKLKKKNGWLWPEVFESLFYVGRYYAPNNNKKRELKHDKILPN